MTRRLLPLLALLLGAPALAQHYSGVDPTSIAVGDFDGDGTCELAVSLTSVGRLSHFRVLDHDHITGPRSVLAGRSTQVDGVEAADLNRDGASDAIAEAGDGFLVWLGSPEGLGRGSYVPADALVWDVAVADFGGDGVPDVAVIAESQVRVYGGRGDGTFAKPKDLKLPMDGNDLAAGDLDGDGRTDLAVALGGNRKFMLFLSRRDGRFEERKVDAGSPAGYLGVGDFDGDGKRDVAAVSGASATFVRGRGDGTFEPGKPVPVTGDRLFQYADVADLDRDGRSDFVSLDLRGDTVGVFMGGPGGLASPTLLEAPGGWNVTAGDVDGDGRADLAVPNVRSSTVSLFFGRGDGTFEPAAFFNVDPNRPQLGVPER